MSDTVRPYDGVRALVLGASGFIGRWVARKLDEAGALVTSVVRHPGEFVELASMWSITGDVVAFDALELERLPQLLQSARPEIVFNLVGYGVDRSESRSDVMARLNCDLVRQLTSAVAALPKATGWTGRRIVHIGSALEYGLVSGVVSESMTPRPHTEYGRTKLAGSLALQDTASRANLSSVVARAFTIFGPGEHGGRLRPTIREAAGKGTTVRLSSGTQKRDFAYVEDVADGLLRLGISSGTPGEVVNLATGRLTTVREFAVIAARVYGLESDRLEFGAEPIRPDEMSITGVDVTRFEERTGWRLPADLGALLRRAAAFEAGAAQHSQ